MKRRRFLASAPALGAVTAATQAAPSSAQSTQVGFSNPQPSFDRPRKIVMSLSERQPARVSEVIGNLGNVQRFYGADVVNIALVAYGPGIHFLLRDESTVKDRVAGLVAIGIELLACGATLATLKKTAADLLPGVRAVPNGIPEIVERQVAGWVYVRP